MLIQEQEIANGVVGHHKIDPAISIDIDWQYAERLRDRVPRGGIDHMHPSLFADIRERSISIVPEQAGRCALESVGWPIRTADADHTKVHGAIDVRRPSYVTTYEEIQQAIVVEVDKSRARIPILPS